MKKWRHGLLCGIMLLAGFAAGCHSPLAVSRSERGLLATGDYHIIPGIDLPKVRGVEGCGAQALAASLAYVDTKIDAETLAEELPWHDEGATPVELLLEARRRGYKASIASGTWDQLAGFVENGATILVMFDAGYEVRWLFSTHELPRVMHWGLVSGIAKDDSRILLAASNARHHVLTREEFERRWAKSEMCLIVVTADEE